MPKSQPDLSLPTAMAILPLQSVTRKRLFGGQYVRAGDYVVILACLYESCALLGRMFKDNVPNLAQLLQVKPGNEEQFFSFLKKTANERWERYHTMYNDNPDSLSLMVLATEYARVGLVFPHGNVRSFDDMKRIGRAAQGKVDIKNNNVWNRLEMTLSEGIGFGLLYPELTWDLVSQAHEPVDLEDDSWKQFFSLTGSAIPEGLTTDSPEQAENVVLDLVRGYVQHFRPELAGTLDLLNRGEVNKHQSG